MKTVDDIVTPPSTLSARQAVGRAALAGQAPAARRQEAAPATPSPHIQPGVVPEALAPAYLAVRMATSVPAIKQAVTDAANALHEARHNGTSRTGRRDLEKSYRDLQAEARSKARSLDHSESLFSDGSVFETRDSRSNDGKKDYFYNESGSMGDAHGHVVESPDSTPEHTVYDYVRDVDGTVYIDNR
jgi:hypothetical protein